MASSFAAQLNEIAAKSTNELDLKAQKTAHSQSLIFDKKVAVSQDFDTIYQICLEGFEDLCRIDPRFREFQRSLFSQHSKTQERDQMTADQNATLDTVIEACLGLLGGRLSLNPAVKVAEWLVRRFRVHEYKTSFLLLTFLPYHATPIFRNLLSILPSLPPQFKLLGPYITTVTNPPRHAVAYGAINNDSFFAAFNAYVLKVCHAGSQHQTLLSFWASITAEAVSGRLDLSKSGRKEIQRQRQEDVLLKILPVLKEGLSIHDCSDMIIACYTIAVILVNKSLLADKLVDSLMEAVVGSLKPETMEAGLVCLSDLTQQKSEHAVRWRTVAKLADVDNIESRLQTLNRSYDIGAFALAMVQSALSNIRGKRENERLDFVERMLLAELMDSPRMVLAIGSLLAVLKSAEQGAISISVRDSVVDLLRKLNDSDTLSALIALAVKEAGLDPAAVEASLQSMVRPPEILPADIDEMDVDDDTPVNTQNPFSRALEHVPQRTVDEHSFLSNSPSHLFEPLLQAFKQAAQSEEGLQLFSRLPLWKTSADLEQPLFASFFMRVFSGPYSVQVRHAALRVVQEWLSGLSDFDSQAILPYVLLQLADPSQRIREAASKVVLAMARAIPSAFVDGELFKQWGAHQLYGSGKADQSPFFLTTKDVAKIVQRAVLPILEECILEPTQIKKALESALKPAPSSNRVKSNTTSNEMKKSLRQSFFRLFLMHVLQTPLYSVKIGLLRLLANVERVGSVLKRKELMPLLHHWASLTPEKVERLASAECLGIRDISSTLCGIVSQADTDAVEALLDLTSRNAKRPDLDYAVSERIKSFWPKLQTESQVTSADSLLGNISDDKANMSDRSQILRDIFRSVTLSTEVIAHLLDRVHSSMNTAREHSPVSKRRRTNEDQAVTSNKSQFESRLTRIRELTFVLELVDSSSPEDRPELLSGLFDILTALHQLRVRHQSDLSYLLSLTVGSLLSIVRNAGLHEFKLDLSAVPLDVIVDCMRATGNSQVQNTALLLIAALASVAPERVLNSVMPVFTLMGTSMLGKDDEYSSYVVDQTMDKVIPSLIESLRTRGQDLVAETTDLVSSFVVAYEHVPLQKRLRLFRKLVSNLGDETFLWVLVSRLIQRYTDDADVVSFIISLINMFELDAQLTACLKLVVHVQRTLATDPDEDTAGTESQNAGDTNFLTAGLSLLRTLDQIFSKSNIKGKMTRYSQSKDNDLPSLMPFFEDLLTRILGLVHTPNLDDVLAATANTVLSSLLSILPSVQLIDITEYFAQTGSEIVRQRILRLLESRIRVKDMHSSTVQAKAISFLQVLFALLKDSADTVSKRAAIACVDQICEAYGRKDMSAVIQAARVISEGNCLCSSDRKLSILALLCLSSIVELVKEAIVPVIPQLMPKVFSLLQSSLDEGLEDFELHDAAFTLIAGLITHVPFIFSDEYLDRIMTFSAESRNADLGAESDEVRGQALYLVWKNLQLSNIVGSLQRTWSVTVENDVSAVQQSLSLLAESVKRSSKSLVIKNADKIWSLILEAFNLRRIQITNRTEDSYADADIFEIEKTINSVAIEVVYKLNDTTFRPLFLRFIDWATKCQDVQSANLSKAQELRQTTLFNFLAHFFNTLKSIVTSYATHIVESALSVLKDISAASSSSPTSTRTSKPKPKPKSKHHPLTTESDPDALPLYLSTLHALHAALHHDTDAHFSTPSLFTPLSSTLVSQLHLASHPTFAPHISPTVIPTLVALATAVIDTPSHLKALNSAICALRRSDDAKVRLASVRAQLALSGVEDVQKDGAQQEEEEGGGGGGGEPAIAIAEEWCTTVLSVGEGMVYVNEMLEDEDEAVESGVRRLVRRVRDVVGEEGIFE